MVRPIYYDCGFKSSVVQAYAPIVGVREHAAVLHYQSNNETSARQSIGENGLILVDAAGAYHGYASGT